MNIEGVVLLIGALGGLEAIRWIINSWVNRKTNARKEVASADAAEIQNLLSVVEKLNKQIGRYDERLKQRDDKVDSVYRDLRQAHDEIQRLIHKYHELELGWKESEIRRCNVRGCTRRQPPSEF